MRMGKKKKRREGSNYSLLKGLKRNLTEGGGSGINAVNGGIKTGVKHRIGGLIRIFYRTVIRVPTG